MKPNFKILTLIALLAVMPLLLPAQAPPHPGGDPTTSGNTPVGGGAPVGNGTLILLSLAALYAGKKMYIVKSNEE